MNPKLSVIIPCYNCERTLREAIVSCYAQGLETNEFEIVMVDDGSVDGTKELMKKLSSEYSNIKLIFHERNKGGGAARNTGIAAAEGELIYCLDSDNVFVPGSMRQLIEFLEKEQVDGVAFYERRFFSGDDLNRFNTHINYITDRSIALIDLFNESDTLLDNFLYTKASYFRTAGYPEHHGFDTQCFEMRYLSAGNRVKVCPGSIFYHRQGMQEQSYFERVHASGMFSINFMLIFEDIFHLFVPQVQKELISFPLFSGNKSYGDNVLNLVKIKVKNGEPIFVPELERHLKPNGLQVFVEEYKGENGIELVATIAAESRQDHRQAFDKLADYIASNRFLTPYLQFLSLRIAHGLSGIPPGDVVKSTLADLNKMKTTAVIGRGSRLIQFFKKLF